MRVLLGIGTVNLGVLALLAGCGGGAQTPTSFTVLGNGDPFLIVDPFGGSGVPPEGAPRYEFHREPSGIRTNLRTVLVDRDTAYAAGDNGRVHRRTFTDSWWAEQTATSRPLYALAAGSDGSLPAVAAVGAGGVVLVEKGDRTEGWVAHDVPVKVDLYAALLDGALVVAGSEGTLFERMGGEWARVETGTREALRVLVSCPCGQSSGTYFAAGDWTLLRCERRAPASPASCRTIPKPPDEVFSRWIDAAGTPPWFVGSNGTLLSPSSPLGTDFRFLHPSPAFNFTGVFDPRDRFAGRDPKSVPLPVAISGKGELVVLSRESSSAVTVQNLGSRVHAIDGALPDMFIVGDAGTMIHGVARNLVLRH
jgi:hypothetical protein